MPLPVPPLLPPPEAVPFSDQRKKKKARQAQLDIAPPTAEAEAASASARASNSPTKKSRGCSSSDAGPDPAASPGSPPTESDERHRGRSSGGREQKNKRRRKSPAEKKKRRVKKTKCKTGDSDNIRSRSRRCRHRSRESPAAPTSDDFDLSSVGSNYTLGESPPPPKVFQPVPISGLGPKAVARWVPPMCQDLHPHPLPERQQLPVPKEDLIIACKSKSSQSSAVTAEAQRHLVKLLPANSFLDAIEDAKFIGDELPVSGYHSREHYNCLLDLFDKVEQDVLKQELKERAIKRVVIGADSKDNMSGIRIYYTSPHTSGQPVSVAMRVISLEKMHTVNHKTLADQIETCLAKVRCSVAAMLSQSDCCICRWPCHVKSGVPGDVTSVL